MLLLSAHEHSSKTKVKVKHLYVYSTVCFAGEQLLMTLDETKKQLCDLKPTFKAKYNVETMEIFG
jgi:hypothetical protein